MVIKIDFSSFVDTYSKRYLFSLSIITYHYQMVVFLISIVGGLNTVRKLLKFNFQ